MKLGCQWLCETVKQMNLERPQFSSEHDYDISLIRCVSVLAIISCHIMQYLEMELAWWFNVGVQVFLCISGYLYGGKSIEDITEFYRKQFSKILIDYYVVVIPVLGIYTLYAREYINLSQAINVLLASGTINGGGHLWFIASILFCYCLTPFFASYFDWADRGSFGFLLLRSAVLMAGAVVMCIKFIPYFNSAIINCYIAGFLLRRISQRQSSKYLSGGGCVCLLFGTVCMNGLQIVHSYVMPLVLPEFLANRWNMYCDYAHAMLGVTIFVVLYSAASRIKFSPLVRKGLDISDRYSYDVYLVHQFLILGPFSLMDITPYRLLNISLILCFVAALAYLVRYLSNKLKECLMYLRFS